MQIAKSEMDSLTFETNHNKDNALNKRQLKASWLKNLSSAELRLFDNQMQLKQIQSGTDLLVQGQPVTVVYFIKEGLVDVLVNNDRVAQRGAMDSLGEMSCFSGEMVASATVRTVTPCQIWEIDREAFLSVIENIPTLRSKMFSIVTSRLQTLSHRFSEILKHIPHGIVKINIDGIITDEFSSRCVDYLGITQLAGKKLGELLFSDNTALSEQWNQTIQSFAIESGSGLGAKLDMLPDEVIYLHPDGNSRVFKLLYHITVEKSGQVTGLDVGIDDVTQSRQYQNELSLFQNMISKLERLLVLIEAESGLIIQETFSHSQLGQMHFPVWKNLKGKNIMNTILNHQASEQREHFQRWLKMLGNQMILKTMSMDELIELSPRFIFETVLGKAIELSFTLTPLKTDIYPEVLGKFEFMEEELESQEFQYSTMELMEEVIAAEAEHPSDLPEALNEMQISLEIVQSQMITPNALVMNHRQIAGMIHSVKGLGQSFGLGTISTAAHEVEEVLSETLKSGQNPTIFNQLLISFKSLLSLIVVSKSLCNTDQIKDLGICRSRELEVRIPLTRFQQIKQELNKILLPNYTETLNKQQLAALINLKDEILSLELVKLETVFPRLQCIITDTAKLLKKQVEFKIMEKTPIIMKQQIIHSLSTCLIQLIKNAVYHGVETTSERQFLGKPVNALIELLIEKKSDRLIVCITDNGKGISIEKTVARAAQLNLIDNEKAKEMLHEKNQNEIFTLLFQPGFSTASSVSLISGRGIGLNMIKTEIESLGGTISINSKENKGTSIYLEVPIKSNKIREMEKKADF